MGGGPQVDRGASCARLAGISREYINSRVVAGTRLRDLAPSLRRRSVFFRFDFVPSAAPSSSKCLRAYPELWSRALHRAVESRILTLQEIEKASTDAQFFIYA